MPGESVVALVLTVLLAKRVLVNDIVWGSLEDARSDPWLKDKPSAKVDTANLVLAKVELQVALAVSDADVRGLNDASLSQGTRLTLPLVLLH
jgi:hypothetical protein